MAKVLLLLVGSLAMMYVGSRVYIFVHLNNNKIMFYLHILLSTIPLSTKNTRQNTFIPDLTRSYLHSRFNPV